MAKHAAETAEKISEFLVPYMKQSTLKKGAEDATSLNEAGIAGVQATLEIYREELDRIAAETDKLRQEAQAAIGKVQEEMAEVQARVDKKQDTQIGNLHRSIQRLTKQMSMPVPDVSGQNLK